MPMGWAEGVDRMGSRLVTAEGAVRCGVSDPLCAQTQVRLRDGGVALIMAQGWRLVPVTTKAPPFPAGPF